MLALIEVGKMSKGLTDIRKAVERMSQSEVVKTQRFSESCRILTRYSIKKVAEKNIRILFLCRVCKRSLLFKSKKEVKLHLEAHHSAGVNQTIKEIEEQLKERKQNVV